MTLKLGKLGEIEVEEFRIVDKHALREIANLTGLDVTSAYITEYDAELCCVVYPRIPEELNNLVEDAVTYCVVLSL